jgi:hypothetical protein
LIMNMLFLGVSLLSGNSVFAQDPALSHDGIKFAVLRHKKTEVSARVRRTKVRPTRGGSLRKGFTRDLIKWLCRS